MAGSNDVKLDDPGAQALNLAQQLAAALLPEQSLPLVDNFVRPLGIDDLGRLSRGSDLALNSILATMRLRDSREVYLSDYLRAAGKPAVALSTPFADTPKVQAEFQLALNALKAVGGGVLILPPGQIAIDITTIKIPSNVIIRGLPWLTKVLIGNGYTGSQNVFENETITTDGSLANPGIKVLDTWFHGANRIFPNWLSRADGTPVTDPEADYRVGGCLAPTTFASISLGVSGGAVNSVTINSGGSGYVYPPTLWISGDGFGAIVTLTISGGAVNGYSIVAGGEGYTAATAEVAGGGANPATALVAANRRNANWNTLGALFGLIKADRPVIRGNRITNYRGMVITDSGCDARLVENNDFEYCGSADSEAVLLWSQSHGSVSAPPAYFRRTTNGVFRHNRIRNCERSVATIGDLCGDYSNNDIDGWGEACFLVMDVARTYKIRGNTAKNGTLTDIVCHFAECSTDADVFDNIVEGVDGVPVKITGDGANVRGNTFIARSSYTAKIPFGPYSERVGYNQGQAAVAGVNLELTNRAAVLIQEATGSAINAPKASMIGGGNKLIAAANGNVFKYGVAFAKGAANAIGDILLAGMDITRSPGTLLFDPVSADACLNKNKKFRVVDNPGHVSMGAVLIHETIASGTTGVKKWTFGFRPRVLIVNARVVIGNQLAHTFAVFVDEAAKNPGTSGGTNTSGGITQLQASLATILATSYNQGALVVSSVGGGNVFNGSAIGFSSDGWSMQINTNTADCTFEVVAIP